MKWHLYLLECVDGSYYAGITNDLDKRLNAHNQGKGARYTRGRAPVKLLRSKVYENRSQASQAEAWVKKQPKSKKLDFFD